MNLITLHHPTVLLEDKEKVLEKPIQPFFENLEHGGTLLGKKLLEMYQESELKDAVVVGCVRGGLPAAEQVAIQIRSRFPSSKPTLDFVVIRKITLPETVLGLRQFGIGALTEMGDPQFNQKLIERHQIDITADSIQEVIAKERLESARRQTLYRGEKKRPDLAGKTVIIVDDSSASGSTIFAAITSIRNMCSDQQKRMIVALPVLTQACRELVETEGKIAPSDICCVAYYAPSKGVFYNTDDFYQKIRDVEDKEVLEVLERWSGT